MTNFFRVDVAASLFALAVGIFHLGVVKVIHKDVGVP